MCNKFSKELSGHRSYVSTSVVVKINRVVKTTLSQKNNNTIYIGLP